MVPGLVQLRADDITWDGFRILGAPGQQNNPPGMYTSPAHSGYLVRDTIFRFELNLRESLILGVVGAGGVGFYIQTYVRSFQYEKAATLTIVVAAIVLAIEATNAAVRRRIS